MWLYLGNYKLSPWCLWNVNKKSQLADWSMLLPMNLSDGESRNAGTILISRDQDRHGNNPCGKVRVCKEWEAHPVAGGRKQACLSFGSTSYLWHTLWCRTTKFGTVKPMKDRSVSGVSHGQSKGSGAPAYQNFGDPLLLPSRFDLEQPNSVWYPAWTVACVF